MLSRSIRTVVQATASTLLISLASLLPARAWAQTESSTGEAEPRTKTVGSLPLDEESTAAIREATTDQEFLTPWVDVLPDDVAVPSPREFLGYSIGTPGQLTSLDGIHGYMRALDESSDRVRVFPMGRSFEGREMILVAIADAPTIGLLDVYNEYIRRLADPRQTSERTAEMIVSKAKPIYWVTAGLHSPELGPPEMVMELAYRLAVEDREPFERIRNNVITLITPVLEVDGRARQVDWYYRHVKGHTDYKDMPPRSAPFWGHYVFHDNNRDAIAVTQPLTRNYLRAFFQWLPTISLDLHESVPLLYVSTGTGPYNERVDPLTVSEWHTLATYEVSRLTALGLPGVWTWGFYTGWYPGYLLWVTNTHNAMGRFYETFGNGSADTMERDLRKARYSGEKITSRQWYRSIPPDEQVTWSLRNNTNYMESGVLASLEMVARNGEMFLSNFYRKGVNSIAKGRNESPHAFAISATQRDPATARTLVEILQRQGIEVRRVEKKVELGEIELSQGDLLVKLDQPYGPLARNLLENQDFPQDVEVPPYDDVAWTLGLHLGVETQAIDDPAVLDLETQWAELESLFEVDNPDKAKVWAIPHRGQRGLGPLRFALADVRMRSAAESFEHEKKMLPAGTLLIEGEAVDTDRLKRALNERGLEAVALKRMPEVETHELDVPRIALLQSWTSTQNAGWARYTLDEAMVPYTLISKDLLRAGGLRNDFDVILIPSFWSSTQAKSVIAGLDPKWGPLAYTRTASAPSHGGIDHSEDITGGFGFEGMEELRRFVSEGGTMIALGSAGVLAAETGMLRDVSSNRPGELRTPGSFLTAKLLRPESPLVYGYDSITHVFRGNGPLYAVDEYDRYLAVMQFGTKRVGDDAKDEADDGEAHGEAKTDKPAKNSKDDSDGETLDDDKPLVRSGGVVQGEAIDGEPALLNVALGDGRVVLFAWNPMHRHLNHHDHAFVYNALLHWNDLPVPQRETH